MSLPSYLKKLRWTLIGPHLSPHPNTDSYQTFTTGPFSLPTWLHQAFFPFCTFSTRTCFKGSGKRGDCSLRRAYSLFSMLLLFFFNLNLFILIRGELIYNIVLVLPYINMNPPQVNASFISELLREAQFPKQAAIIHTLLETSAT